MRNQSKAYRRFLASRLNITVAIGLGLSCEEVKRYYFEYLSPNYMENFVRIIIDHSYLLPFLYKVAEKMNSHEFDDSGVNIMIHTE